VYFLHPCPISGRIEQPQFGLPLFLSVALNVMYSLPQSHLQRNLRFFVPHGAILGSTSLMIVAIPNFIPGRIFCLCIFIGIKRLLGKRKSGSATKHYACHQAASSDYPLSLCNNKLFVLYFQII
jgi:hypothetical protein